jgi:hypothetical protein
MGPMTVLTVILALVLVFGGAWLPPLDELSSFWTLARTTNT